MVGSIVTVNERPCYSFTISASSKAADNQAACERGSSGFRELSASSPCDNGLASETK